MMVDSATVQKIGVFADVYIHAVADYDYTMTANKAGLDVLIAPGFYGYCEDDHGVNWLSGKHSLKQRINYLYSPKGLAYKEYLVYIKKHFPLDYFEAKAKLWLKTFFPIIWDTFKKKDEKY
jgi:GT2 family glycosyltransferase